MSHYFFDSSALIKRYAPEQGTRWIRSIAAPVSGHLIFIAQITRIEVVSGLSRRQREGHFSAMEIEGVRRLMNRHIVDWYIVVGLDTQVMLMAEDLLRKHPLRAYDAVQLASALEGQRRLVAGGLEHLSFVCADTRLSTIAAAQGLSTIDPNSYP